MFWLVRRNFAIRYSFRRIDKSLRLRRDLPDSERVRAVAVDPAVACADVDLDNVPFFEYPVFFRNSVNYLVIDADTSTAGEAAVSEERRAGAAFDYIIVDDPQRQASG